MAHEDQSDSGDQAQPPKPPPRPQPEKGKQRPDVYVYVKNSQDPKDVITRVPPPKPEGDSEDQA